MTTDKNDITVKIMDRDFTIKCPTAGITDLHKAAKYFDSKIRDIQHEDSNKKLINIDNLIVVTALNISHELLIQKKQNRDCIDHMNQQINDLHNLIEQAVAEEK